MNGWRDFRIATALLLVGLTPLAGCTTGKTFSIAMAAPGSMRTVLVVGDDGGVEAGMNMAPAAAQTVTSSPAVTNNGLVGPRMTLLQSQDPTALAALGSELLKLGSISALAPATTVGLGNAPLLVGVGKGALASNGAQISVSTSPSTDTAIVTTPVATVTGVVTLTSSAPVQLATLVGAPMASPFQSVQVGVTSPVSTLSPLAGSLGAAATATANGVSDQVATPLAATTVSAPPSQSLQVAVTSPVLISGANSITVSAAVTSPVLVSGANSITVSAAVTSPVLVPSANSITVNAQAALGGASGVLSAPAPGRTVSPASSVQTPRSALFKLKHG